MTDMEYELTRFEAEKDIESYIEEYVDVETFLECCKSCPNYGNVWSCPPFDFDPIEYWRSFSKLKVAGYRVDYPADRTEEAMTKALWEVKQKLAEELYAEEEENPGSESLSAGTCQICSGCTRPDGEPCRFPGKRRYSIESIGGNVGKTISQLCGVDLEWIEEGKLTEHFVLVGGLLIK